jgi:hypothetical protein
LAEREKGVDLAMTMQTDKMLSEMVRVKSAVDKLIL